MKNDEEAVQGVMKALQKWNSNPGTQTLPHFDLLNLRSLHQNN